MRSLAIHTGSRTAVGARCTDALILGADRLRQWSVRAWGPMVRACGGLPAWTWPLLVAATAWPSVAWTARRWADGSDDPLGILALATLGLAMIASRAAFGRVGRGVRIPYLLASAAVAMVAAVGPAGTPDLLRAVVAMGAFVLALVAVVDEDEPFLPYAGLAFLALPLLSSLQFYAGFPLRVVTAEATRGILVAIGETVVREGSALQVDGHLILVDAPCSGVRMAWVGYFTAFAAAWLFRVGDRALLRRLPLVGVCVLGGNIVRNTILVVREAHGASASNGAHEAVGLVVLALVCTTIVTIFSMAAGRVRAVPRLRVERGVSGRNRPIRIESGDVVASLVFVVLGAGLVATILRMAPRPRDAQPVASRPVEWPVVFDGRPLVPIALSDIERRFAAGFPGAIGRFDNGGQVVVLRDVLRPTRMLHPASDCYRALGYAIEAERLERTDGALSRCFLARRGPAAVRVCERIVASDGGAFTDASSWYWAATLGRSHGPWRASTIATPVAGDAS